MMKIVGEYCMIEVKHHLEAPKYVKYGHIYFYFHNDNVKNISISNCLRRRIKSYLKGFILSASLITSPFCQQEILIRKPLVTM